MVASYRFPPFCSSIFPRFHLPVRRLKHRGPGDLLIRSRVGLVERGATVLGGDAQAQADLGFRCSVTRDFILRS